MAVNSLCTAFRRIVLHRKAFTGNLTASYSMRTSEPQRSPTLVPVQNSYVDSLKAPNDVRVTFAPRTLNVDFGLPIPGGSKGPIVDSPILKIPTLDRVPKLPVVGDVTQSEKSVDLPPGEIVEKRAVNMIIIRRKKMKKHKRLKMRKKFSAQRLKITRRREMAREKQFAAEQEAKIQEANAFSAEKYVKERLALFQKEIIPKTFRGEILPTSVVKKMLDEKKMKEEKKRNKPRLTL